MLICDTREKRWSHIETYLIKNGLEYECQALNVGDYYCTDNPNVVVDRKASLDEVCSNLMPGKNNYHRFINECRRAREQGKQLIILVENRSIFALEDVVKWKSRYTNYTGKWLLEGMLKVQNTYGVRWEFTSKQRCAERIMELLTRGAVT